MKTNSDLSFTLYEILKESISEKGIIKHKSTSEIKFCEGQVHSIKKRIHKIIKRTF